jgi:hypothetical protein
MKCIKKLIGILAYLDKKKSCFLHAGLLKSSFVGVIPGRFERPTHSLEGCCSVQLSYGTSIFGCKGKKK